MGDRIAMIVGYGIMWLSASAIVTLAAGVLMQQVWVRVIRPAHLMADYQEWRRAKASGAWQWPRIVTPATPPDGEGR